MFNLITGFMLTAHTLYTKCI